MNRSRYRYVNFIGGRILQAREMDKLQDITRGVDDTNQPTAFDLDAVYREGATLNVTPAVTPGTKTVTLTAVDGTKPMLVFVRGRWEILAPGEAPAVTLELSQTELYLNWQLVKRTLADDDQLKDITTEEATAEMGELVLAVSATDDSVRAALDTEFEKNTAPVVLFSFVHAGATVTLDPASNVQTQALADDKTAGLVKVTTATGSGVVPSTDDPRMTDERTPLDLSVVDAKVRVPVQDGVATNADGTPRYDLTKDDGGISAAKIVYQAGKQLVSDALAWLKSAVADVVAALEAHIGTRLGESNTHPMPTYNDVGAAPAGHVGKQLGEAGSHPAVVATSQGGFRVNRDKDVAAVAGDPGYGIFEDAEKIAALTHDGDVFSKLANAEQASPLLEGDETNEVLGAGTLGNMSKIALALAAHLNKKSHKNPHGLAPEDIGAATLDYVNTQDQNVLGAAVAFAELLGSIAVRKVTSVAPTLVNIWVPWGVQSVYPTATVTRYFGWVIVNFGSRFELAFGEGTLMDGESIPLPPAAGGPVWSANQMLGGAGISSYLDKNDLDGPTWSAGVGSMSQAVDGQTHRPTSVYAKHSSAWGTYACYGHVSAVAWRFLTQPPVIIQLDKISGAAGTVVTMTGRNFGADAAKVALSVGGTAAVITSCEPTKIVFTIPAVASGAKAVTLAINGVNAINQTSFTVS